MQIERKRRSVNEGAEGERDNNLFLIVVVKELSKKRLKKVI